MRYLLTSKFRQGFSIFFVLFVFFSWVHSQDKVKIALWGDSRENLDNACENIIEILRNRITDWDFMVHTGDFTHSGKDEDWQRSLSFKGMKEILVPGRFFMCTSNHDGRVETYDKYTAGLLPANSLDSTTHFYSHRLGNVFMVFCDGIFTDPRVMQAWLDKELETVRPDEWLIGVWHQPCYGDFTYKQNYLDKCGPWLNSLFQHGGDFVLHGHAHVYVRTKSLLPDGTVDEKNGMVHIVNGVGGASWKDPQPKTAMTAFTPEVPSFPCITFITLSGNQVVVQTVDARPEKKLAVVDEWIWTR